MDIKFAVNNFSFNVRSSCIIKDKSHEKVILNKMRAETHYETFLLPGGRLSVMENSSEAVKREIKEELGISLDCKLISIEENIVEKNKFHMLEFVYYAEIENFNIIKCLDDGWDKFQIFEINNIENVDIRPKTVKELIKQDIYDNLEHHINYDWL